MNTPKATRAGRMNAQPVGFDLPVRTPACLDTGAGCGGVVGVSMVVTCRRSSTSSQPGLDDGVLDVLGGLLRRGRGHKQIYKQPTPCSQPPPRPPSPKGFWGSPSAVEQPLGHRPDVR